MLAVASLSIGALTAAGGCSSRSGNASSGGTCTPGAQVACACPGGGSGVQACRSDGSGLDACQCGGGAQDASNDTTLSTDDGSSPESGTDGAVDAGPCDPIAQTGCASGQKCTWIRDAVTPALAGHVGCAPDGNVTVKGACSFGASGPTTGYDNCQKGAVCKADTTTEQAAGTCEAICDPSASSGTGACATNYLCITYSGYFSATPTDGGAAAPSSAGLCEASCNPLTNTTADGAPACGGTVTNGQASKGCYGFPSQTTQPSTFSCAPDLYPNETSDVPVSGMVYVNSCAPGFVPLLTQSWQSNTGICVAYCEPGNTSASAPANAAGLVGSGHTCADAGAGGTHECRFWWWIEGETGSNTPISAASNGVGFCVDYTQYKYDSNNDGTIDASDANWPSCTTLSSTGHTFSSTMTDTQFWGCESVTTRPQ